MKSKLLILLIGLSKIACTQNRNFLEHVYNSPNHFYASESEATSERIELLNFNGDELSGTLIKAIRNERIRRNRPDLEQDSLLNRIAKSGIATYSKSRFVYTKIWREEKKSIQYALMHEKSEFKLYEAHAFTLDVLDLKYAESFYYDPKPGTSNVNLYFGKKPEVRNPDDPEYVEPYPIESVRETILCQRLITLLSKGIYKQDFLSRNFSRLGIAIKLDKNSINRSMRPRIFIILIFGGKQLQRIKIPAEMLNENYTKLEEN